MKKRLSIITAALLFLVTTGMSHASTVFYDDFNSENTGQGALNYSAFAQWTVSDGTVDLIGNGSYDFYPGNGLYVDLDGSTWLAGTMTTKETFAPGHYNLSFDLGGSTRGDMNTVHIALGNWSSSLDVPTNYPFAMTYYYDIILNDFAPLSFHNDGRDNFGAILDNVTLTTSPELQRPVPAVPEPGTIMLLIPGLLGLAAWGKSRKNI